MSYRKKHIKNKIHGIKPRKSIFKKLWFWAVILFMVVISTGIYVVCFCSVFQVKDVLIYGNDKVKTQDLEEFISKGINIDLIDFLNIKISSRGIFLINKDKIEKDILEGFPVIESANVIKKLPQTLVFNVVERRPFGVFCPISVGGQNGGCFFIDQKGFIFDPLLKIPDNFMIVRQPAEDQQFYAGKKIVADNIMDAIFKIQKNMKDNFQIGLKEALIVNSSRLNIVTNENWKIYFNLSGNSDINLQITKLEILLGS